MAAREDQRKSGQMTVPLVTVLQLDTDFPRIAGDVGARESYARAPQILRIDGASVRSIVTDRPKDIDMAPFEEALSRAEGDIIVTSCGFLSYWQDHLAAKTNRPFIASALCALEDIAQSLQPSELSILTFDATRLGAVHLGGHPDYATSITGLPTTHHLRDVISNNRPDLDATRARKEMVQLVTKTITSKHRHILLECTNLPPYRAAIEAATGLPVTDIMTLIEATCPGAIAPQLS